MTDRTLTAEHIRTMTLEDFLAACEVADRQPSRVLSDAGL